jgi:hypothetical protein
MEIGLYIIIVIAVAVALSSFVFTYFEIVISIVPIWMIALILIIIPVKGMSHSDNINYKEYCFSEDDIIKDGKFYYVFTTKADTNEIKKIQIDNIEKLYLDENNMKVVIKEKQWSVFKDTTKKAYVSKQVYAKIQG